MDGHAHTEIGNRIINAAKLETFQICGVSFGT